MNLRDVLDQIIEPVYALGLLPREWDTPKSRVMLLAIGLQESRFEHRVQIGGPAHGLWQFEMGGGVSGVLHHPLVYDKASTVCRGRDVPALTLPDYTALATDDILAAAFARLLLRTDPRVLPEITDVQAGWDCYERNWRPGQPHPETWRALHAQAVAAVSA